MKESLQRVTLLGGNSGESPPSKLTGLGSSAMKDNSGVTMSLPGSSLGPTAGLSCTGGVLSFIITPPGSPRQLLNEAQSPVKFAEQILGTLPNSPQNSKEWALSNEALESGPHNEDSATFSPKTKANSIKESGSRGEKTDRREAEFASEGSDRRRGVSSASIEEEFNDMETDLGSNKFHNSDCEQPQHGYSFAKKSNPKGDPTPSSKKPSPDSSKKKSL